MKAAGALARRSYRAKGEEWPISPFQIHYFDRPGLTKIRVYDYIVSVRHEGTVNGRIREVAGEIADCLPSVLSAVGPAKAEGSAKEGGFPPSLKLRRTGRIACPPQPWRRRADLTAKNPARPAATEGVEPRIPRIPRIQNSRFAPPPEDNLNRSKRRQRRSLLPSFPSFPSVLTFPRPPDFCLFARFAPFCGKSALSHYP